MSRDLAADFTVGAGPKLARKKKENMRQLERQMDGLNSMSANDLLNNLKTVKRGGLAQRQAREEFRNDLVEK